MTCALEPTLYTPVPTVTVTLLAMPLAIVTYGVTPESLTVIEREACPLLVRFAEVNETFARLTDKTAGLAVSLVMLEVS